MEKSEMVDLIESIIHDSWSWKSGDRYLATYILDKIVEAGMLPPPTINQKIKQLKNSPISYHNKWDK